MQNKEKIKLKITQDLSWIIIFSLGLYVFKARPEFVPIALVLDILVGLLLYSAS